MMNKLIFGCKQVLVPYYESLRLADTDESLQGILDLKNELQHNSDRKNDLQEIACQGIFWMPQCTIRNCGVLKWRTRKSVQK